jgi:plasmid stability protein
MPHVQIRNVPPEVHRTLKARAAQRGMSLSEYLLDEVTRLAAAPTAEELIARIQRRSRVKLSEPAADTIRRIRDTR